MIAETLWFGITGAWQFDCLGLGAQNFALGHRVSSAFEGLCFGSGVAVAVVIVIVILAWWQ